MTATTTPTAIDSGDLWRWVDRLTQDRKQRLVRKPPHGKPRIEYVTIPSLWTQLMEAEASSNGGGGRGKADAGSRSPIHLEVVALLTEITDTVIDALISHGAKPRIETSLPAKPPSARPALRLLDQFGKPALDPDVAGRLVERAARPTADYRYRRDLAQLRHDTRTDLRQLATIVIGARDQDLTDWWADRYRWWTARAETALAADDETIDTRGVRGRACPQCQTLWVTSERDGETYRDPALLITFHDGQVRHITCRACTTSWWRGEDVDTLTQQLAGDEAIQGPSTPPAAEKQVAVGDYADRLRPLLRAQTP
jgi:hypothetical protein